MLASASTARTHFVVFLLLVRLRKFHLPHPARPGRMQAGDLPVDRAIAVLRAGQVAGTDQELAYDLAAGEDKGLLQD